MGHKRGDLRKQKDWGPCTCAYNWWLPTHVTEQGPGGSRLSPPATRTPHPTTDNSIYVKGIGSGNSKGLYPFSNISWIATLYQALCCLLEIQRWTSLVLTYENFSNNTFWVFFPQNTHLGCFSLVRQLRVVVVNTWKKQNKTIKT